MKMFLKIDYFLQYLLLILMAVCLIYFPISMLLLLVFGGWQLISGLVTTVFFRRLERKGYLLISFGYLFFLGAANLLSEQHLLPDFLDNFVAFLIFVIFIPAGIGIWYFRMVYKDYHRIFNTKKVLSNTMEMNSPMEKRPLLRINE